MNARFGRCHSRLLKRHSQIVFGSLVFLLVAVFKCNLHGTSFSMDTETEINNNVIYRQRFWCYGRMKEVKKDHSNSFWLDRLNQFKIQLDNKVSDRLKMHLTGEIKSMALSQMTTNPILGNTHTRTHAHTHNADFKLTPSRHHIIEFDVCSIVILKSMLSTVGR